MNDRSRVPVVVILILALIATGFTREIASERRVSTPGRSAVGAQSNSSNGPSLSRMNSFALALLLGGLRGPLVMFLWSNSESRKADKDLEGVDTQIEWIRLLQPEFDTVHIFQVWNKAYNLSAQMASLSNKYLTIIDAIDYARKVNLERPDDINIVYEIGRVFGDKLGDSSEKLYYNRRVRSESLPHESQQKLSESSQGYRRLQLDAVLDASGHLLPEMVKPTGVWLSDPKDPSQYYDGSELAPLKQFEPYPYGVSPTAFGYAYRKRAQLLARFGGQVHAQLSDLVIDSRPALDLKRWAETEWDFGRRSETEAFGKPVTTEKTPLESTTADVALNAYIDETVARPLLKRAIYSYNLASDLVPAADKEYAVHLTKFPVNFETYASHRDELAALRQMMIGDRDYLKLLLAPNENRAALLAEAKHAYERAIVHYNYILLRYYCTDDIAAKVLPQGVSRSNLSRTIFADFENASLDLSSAMTQQMITLMVAQNETRGLDEDVTDFLAYIRRCAARIDHISEATTANQSASTLPTTR